jgi:PIN domain nuclease of toxin-antitoxin system
MNVLLDTHILVWMLNGYSLLTEDSEFQDLFLNRINEIYFSAISIWEIELKRLTGKTNFKYDGKEIYYASLDSNMVPMPLFPKHCLKLKDSETPQKDPFDRILLAQAKDNDLILLTHDSRFKDLNDKNVYYLALSNT